MKCEYAIQAIIETGLNMIAQDLIKPTHTQKDIDNYIKEFPIQHICIKEEHE